MHQHDNKSCFCLFQSWLLLADMGDLSFNSTDMLLTTEMPNEARPTFNQNYWRDKFYNLPEYKAHVWIKDNIPMVLLIIGLVGNMISLAVLLRRPMRQLSTYAFLAGLCVADSMTLMLTCIPPVLERFATSPEDSSSGLCKTKMFLHQVFSHYASWLLVSVTVERYIAVVYPMRTHMLCKRRRAYKTMTFIFITLMAVNCHVFFTHGLTENLQYGNNNTQVTHYKCDSLKQHHDFISGPWQWIDTFLYSMGPFLIIIVLNTVIVYQIRLANRQRKGMVSNSKNPKDSQEADRRMTIMFLSITFAFLVLVLPINIILILRHLVKVGPYPDVMIKHNARMSLAETIGRVLMTVNHSINFFLYCATGRKFRQELCLLCRCKCKEQAVRRSSYVASRTCSTTLSVVNATRHGGRQSPRLTPQITPSHTPRSSLV